MQGNSNNISDENILALLLEVKDVIKKHLNTIEFLIITFTDGKFIITVNEELSFSPDGKVIAVFFNKIYTIPTKSVIFQIDENFSACLIQNQWLDERNVNLLLLYLPISLLPLKAFRLKRPVVLLHFAQSLDGRIAANNGNSKWIGNHENLVHAHWLRALFDGILIGSNTLRIDKPRLNVRLVKGPNPSKFVIGSSLNEFDSLLENKGEVFYITSGEPIIHSEIENIVIPGEGKHIDPLTILYELYERGIQTLFIEGGAYTGSSFISAKAIDYLQIFISPKILGSGIACFSLQEISNIDQSIEFLSQTFVPMGNGMLFSGVLKY